MKMKFDFTLETWIRGLVVEGADKEDCVKKLREMTLSEIIEEFEYDNGDSKDSEVKDLDYEIIEREVHVEAYDIEYDVDEEHLELPDDCTEADVERAKADVIAALPDKMMLSVMVSSLADVADEAMDQVSEETGWLVRTLKTRVISDQADEWEYIN